MIVTVPSAAMRMKALGARGGGGAPPRPWADARTPKKERSIRPPPARALSCRNSRRARRAWGVVAVDSSISSSSICIGRSLNLLVLRHHHGRGGGVDCQVDGLANASVGTATAEVIAHGVVDLPVRWLGRSGQ